MRSGRNALAAAPELLLALTCLAAFFIPELAARNVKRLSEALVVEFLAIHAFPFLGGLALLKPARSWTRIMRALMFVVIAAGYSYFASAFGADSVASFWILAITTYFGFFVHDAPEQRRKMLVCRWAVTAVAYVLVMLAGLLTADLLGIRSPRREPLVGFLFFCTLAVFDWTAFYDRTLAWYKRSHPAQ